MPFIKAMPLVFAVVAPIVMPAGPARGGDAPIILAQFSPQEKDDQKKQQKQQQQPQRSQGGSQQQAPQRSQGGFQQQQGQAPQRNLGGVQQQQGQAPQRGQSGFQQQQQQQRGQGGFQQQPRVTGGDPQKHAQDALQQPRSQGGAQQQPRATAGQHPAGPGSQQKLAPGNLPQPRGQGGSQQPPQSAGGQQPGGPGGAQKFAPGNLQQPRGQGGSQQPPQSAGSQQSDGPGGPQKHAPGNLQQRAQDSSQQPRALGGTHQQPLGGPGGLQTHSPGAQHHAQDPQQARRLFAPRRELSAEERREKAERDAHAADRARLIERQKEMAAHEKSQAAIHERRRIEEERLRAISSQRHQSVDAHGQTIIKEPGNRTILHANGRAFVQHDETAHFHAFGGNAHTRRAPNGNSISTIVRPDGVRLEIEVDHHGRPLRRVRHLPDGRRFVLFENRALAAGAALALGALIVSLPPVEPREEYILDAGEASEDDMYAALHAGPIAPLDRAYSLEEVLASISLRERMRAINIDSINFDFGSSEVGPDQAEMLETVAAVIRDMVNQNPGEVFVVEGHTDAVGSEIDNLSLSDRRAGAVADVLAQTFNIPRENLVTQGYGKQFLVVETPEPERRNRRVVIRRITPLLQADAGHYSSAGPGEMEPR